jgi:hypothetical protein
VVGPFVLAVLRLAGLLASVGLVTSRLGLVAHELVGHGGVAIACGGRVIDAGLFWFAGGWIRYDLDTPSLPALIAVAAGGIAVEAVAGTVLWLALARRTSLAARVARGVGAALVIHAAWYLATGTWHGFGDGVLLYRELGAARAPVAIGAGLVACGMAYLGARSVLGALAATIPGRRGARIAGLAAAAVIAGGLQLGLAVGEVQVRGDATYGAIMTRERDRVIARELAAWQREQALRGIAVDDAERARRERELADRHRELPFAPLLGLATALAIGLGAWRARPGADAAVPGRVVAIAWAAAAGSVALVIAIDAWFG